MLKKHIYNWLHKNQSIQGELAKRDPPVDRTEEATGKYAQIKVCSQRIGLCYFEAYRMA